MLSSGRPTLEYFAGDGASISSMDIVCRCLSSSQTAQQQTSLHESTAVRAVFILPLSSSGDGTVLVVLAKGWGHLSAMSASVLCPLPWAVVAVVARDPGPFRIVLLIICLHPAPLHEWCLCCCCCKPYSRTSTTRPVLLRDCRRGLNVFFLCTTRSRPS